MAEVFVFHHALGLTDGVRSFADSLRSGGYRVTTPDLFDGKVFDDLDAGVAHADGIGFAQLAERGAHILDGIADPVVVLGFSLGALPAQRAAQTLPNITGAVLLHSAVPLGFFADDWPLGVGLQVHLGERDPWANEDIDAARELQAAGGELFWYDTDRHLVCDDTTADHDPEIAAIILDRILTFLAAV